MAVKKSRIKSAAAAYTPQSREQVSNDIKKIGDLQRELIRTETRINDEIAVITSSNTPAIEALKAELDILQKGVQTWCEANRDEITGGGKTKTANLITGEVSWRTRPDSVVIKGSDAVIDALESFGLHHFIRVKEEINKEAILADKKAVEGIKGISVISGREVFAVTPFEQEIEK